jgi:hypothetical protein
MCAPDTVPEPMAAGHGRGGERVDYSSGEVAAVSDTLPAYSLNAIRDNQVVCPHCGAKQVAAVTHWTLKDRHTVTLSFDCQHGRVVARVKQAKGKR